MKKCPYCFKICLRTHISSTTHRVLLFEQVKKPNFNCSNFSTHKEKIFSDTSRHLFPCWCENHQSRTIAVFQVTIIMNSLRFLFLSVVVSVAMSSEEHSNDRIGDIVERLVQMEKLVRKKKDFFSEWSKDR